MIRKREKVKNKNSFFGGGGVEAGAMREHTRSKTFSKHWNIWYTIKIWPKSINAGDQFYNDWLGKNKWKKS